MVNDSGLIMAYVKHQCNIFENRVQILQEINSGTYVITAWVSMSSKEGVKLWWDSDLGVRHQPHKNTGDQISLTSRNCIQYNKISMINNGE